MRTVQEQGTRGSLKWIQRAVADRPDLLQPPGLPPIRWVSPLADDDFAEYRDAAFLERLGIGRLAGELSAFWPARGPQWDALGLAGDEPILAEAKAHLREFWSPPTQAGAASRVRIEAAFAQVKDALGVRAEVDWTGTFYQFANRLAHLWWLRSQGVPAHLVFVDFLDDEDMRGPTDPEAWDCEFQVAATALDLPDDHVLSPYIHHVRPSVRHLQV